MEYDLSRIDYTICGITFPDTLKILPASGPKTQQKFVVGDKNGVLQCLSIKDEEPVVQFKTLPGKPITAVQVAINDGTQGDKVFAASGNEVKGYTRKGKVFLSIETSLSETITSMSILAGDLILCSGRTVTHYRDLKEFHCYTCDDRVLDIAAFATPNNTRVRLLVLVANKGAVMLENGQIAARVVVAAGPTRLSVPPPLHAADIYAFYGAGDASIGLLGYEESMLTNKCLVEGKGLGSVMCLGWYFSNGIAHLAVGRHDGSVQLYLIDIENLADKPRLKYTYFSGEPVTSVCGGCVGIEEDELLVTTFSGRVFALRSSRLASAPGIRTNVSQEILTSRRSKLEVEVARLEKQVTIERDKYQRNTRSLQEGVSAPPLLDVQHELLGAYEDGWQEARIMGPVPLDMLFIYCNRKLDMRTDSAAVISVCDSQGSASDFLATVRCQAGTRRLWVRMRLAAATMLMDSTRVLIYVLPAGAPRVARLITLRLPALPYYSQHEDQDSDSESRVWCELRVSGSFSVAEMTAWLSEALPGELPRPAASVVIARSHTLLKTILVCRFQRGQAVFKSDNISTISILRHIISNCSIEKSIRLESHCDIPDNACVKSFKKLEQLFKIEYQKHKDINLKKALNALDLDISMMDDNDPMLCEEYMRVWKLSMDNDLEPHFDILVDTVIQWYTDWKTMTLHNSDQGKEKIKLHAALLECDLDSVYKIISQAPSSHTDS